MPREVIGYEGEGRARRPIYRDEVIDVSPMAGLPVGSPEAAEAIARVAGGHTREAREANAAAWGRETIGDRPAMNSPEHLQQSRLNGARRTGEVHAALRAVKEVTTMTELHELDPEPLDPLQALADAANAVREARLAQDAAREAHRLAGEVLDAAVAVLQASWDRVGLEVVAVTHLVEPPPDPVEVADQVEAAWEEHEAEAVVVAPPPAPTKHEAPKPKGLTAHQQRTLDAVVAADGNRNAAATAMGVEHYQSVDVVLEAIGKKGFLPADLIPKLPARFAKFTAAA